MNEFNENGGLMSRQELEWVRKVLDLSDGHTAEDFPCSEKSLLTSLLQASPSFFVALSEDAKTLTMNRSMLDRIGYTEEEVQGKDFPDCFVPEAGRESFIKAFRGLVKNRRATEHQNHVVTKDGRKLFVEWHGRSCLPMKAIDSWRAVLATYFPMASAKSGGSSTGVSRSVQASIPGAGSSITTTSPNANGWRTHWQPGRRNTGNGYRVQTASSYEERRTDFCSRKYLTETVVYRKIKNGLFCMILFQMNNRVGGFS